MAILCDVFVHIKVCSHCCCLQLRCRQCVLQPCSCTLLTHTGHVGCKAPEEELTPCTVLSYSLQGPAPNYVCKECLMSIQSRIHTRLLSTYLGGRPPLPVVAATSPHSEKMAPLWTDSSNLRGKRDSREPRSQASK